MAASEARVLDSHGGARLPIAVRSQKQHQFRSTVCRVASNEQYDKEASRSETTIEGPRPEITAGHEGRQLRLERDRSSKRQRTRASSRCPVQSWQVATAFSPDTRSAQTGADRRVWSQTDAPVRTIAPTIGARSSDTPSVRDGLSAPADSHCPTTEHLRIKTFARTLTHQRERVVGR